MSEPVEILQSAMENRNYYGLSSICDFDPNGECLICDCTPKDCAFVRLHVGDFRWESLDRLLEMFKDHLTPDQVIYFRSRGDDTPMKKAEGLEHAANTLLEYIKSLRGQKRDMTGLGLWRIFCNQLERAGKVKVIPGDCENGPGNGVVG